MLLRHAWLTVLDGDRPGRQIILTNTALTLGSDPSAGLPFLRDTDRGLLPHHVRIVRGRDGAFSLLPAAPAADADVTMMKNGTRRTHSLKNQAVNGIVLENDCVITCGRNSIRFHERAQRAHGDRARSRDDRRNGSRQLAPNAGTIGAGVGEANIAGREASSDAAALTSRESRCGARGGAPQGAGWCEKHGGADTGTNPPPAPPQVPHRNRRSGAKMCVPMATSLHRGSALHRV